MVAGVKINGRFAWIALLAMLLTATGNASELQKPVTLRITNGEWPPYLSVELPHNGIASRIVSDAFARQGIQVQYGFFPWNRAFQLARRGAWHGTAVWLSSPERERDFYLSDPVVEARYVFFHLADTAFDWQTIDDLAQWRLGGTLEYHYGEAFQQAERDGKLRIERVASDEQNFARLLARRIDVFPMDEAVGNTLLRKNFSARDQARIHVHPLPLRVDALRLLLSRKQPENAEYMRRFNLGLKDLRDNGSIRRYLNEVRELPSPAESNAVSQP